MTPKKIKTEPSSKVLSRTRLNKVVLVDDSNVDLFINESILKSISLTKEVNTSVEPEKYIDQLQNAERLSDIPELIFLDLDMEDDCGFTFLDRFAELSDFIRNKCKIVIFSSSTKKDIMVRALMHPSVIRYLVKPLDIAHLKDFIYS